MNEHYALGSDSIILWTVRSHCPLSSREVISKELLVDKCGWGTGGRTRLAREIEVGFLFSIAYWNYFLHRPDE